MTIPPTGSAAIETLDEFPLVRVVVSELNSEPTIQHCIESLLGQDYPADRIHVAVIDAGSTDGTLQKLGGLAAPNLEVRVVPRCSEAAGQRLATGEAREPLIFLTNSDVYVPVDWVSRHVAWHRRGYNLVSGGVLQAGDTVNFSRNVRTNGRLRAFPTDGAGFGFCNLSVRTSLMQGCGGIRELPSQHDSEFAHRILAYGARPIIDPSIEVVHDHPLGSVKASFWRSFWYAVNHERLMPTPRGFGIVSRTDGLSPWEFSIPRVLREMVGIEAWSAYREFLPRCPSWVRAPSFPEFLFFRCAGKNAGELIGLSLGRLSGPAPDRLVDAHGIRAK